MATLKQFAALLMAVAALLTSVLLFQQLKNVQRPRRLLLRQ